MTDYESRSPLDRITAAVSALTEQYRHREELTVVAARLHRKRRHEADHPPLLEQLDAALERGTDDDLEGAAFAFGSSPPCNLEALACLTHIEALAIDWLSWRFGRSLRENTAANLRALVGAATEPGRTHDELSELARALSRAVAWCRIETGWDRAPFSPRIPCPACNHKQLRIRGDGTAARCMACQEAWSEAADDLPSVILLGEAIQRQIALQAESA